MVHFSILTFGKVALVYEPRNHVAVLQIIVVVWTIYVGWYDTGKHTVMLLVVCPGGGDIRRIYKPQTGLEPEKKRCVCKNVSNLQDIYFSRCFLALV